MDIIERLHRGGMIRLDDPEYHKVQEQIDWTFTKIVELNKSPFDQVGNMKDDKSF